MGRVVVSGDGLGGGALNALENDGPCGRLAGKCASMEVDENKQALMPFQFCAKCLIELLLLQPHDRFHCSTTLPLLSPFSSSSSSSSLFHSTILTTTPLIM